MPPTAPCRFTSPTGCPARTWTPTSRARRGARSSTASSARRSWWPPGTSRPRASEGSSASKVAVTGEACEAPRSSAGEAAGEALDEVVDEERVEDGHRQAGQERGGHQRAPVVD